MPYSRASPPPRGCWRYGSERGTPSPVKYVLLVHLAATLVMLGVIWFVQIVYYPLFSRVGSGGFALYSDAHLRLFSPRFLRVALFHKQANSNPVAFTRRISSKPTSSETISQWPFRTTTVPQPRVSPCPCLSL